MNEIEIIDRLNAQISSLKEQVNKYQNAIDRYDDYNSSKSHYFQTKLETTWSGITFVVVAYNIDPQIHNTILSCSPSYQRCDEAEIEIIIIDNGSDIPLNLDDFKEYPSVSKVIRVDGSASPVKGLNIGIGKARFDVVGLMIDGAHIITPNIVNHTKEIIAMFPRPVISVPQYTLGEISQNLDLSQLDSKVLDEQKELLSQSNWPEDGYGLFNVSVRVGEHPDKDWLKHIESNCLITTKDVLEKNSVLNEKFDEAGGGFANLEIYERLINTPENEYVLLLGEGTFHQFHGGITTNASVSDRQEKVNCYREKYKEITGNDLRLVTRRPFVYGRVGINASNVPTISREYGIARRKLSKQLSKHFILNNGKERGKMFLSKKRSIDENALRPFLPPTDLLTSRCQNEGLEPKDFHYLVSLQKIHQMLNPKLYLEIGIYEGKSLALARCQAVGIDPDFEIRYPLIAPTRIVKQTSDTFFKYETRCQNWLKRGVDLAYIDGMHLADFVIRDFMNIEKYASERGVILIDDVCPDLLQMIGREREYVTWCGDVYKSIPILRKYRPDLRIDVFEAFSNRFRKGLAIISGLDKKSRVLEEAYDDIEKEIFSEDHIPESVDELEKLVGLKPISELDEYLDKLFQMDKKN